MAKTPALTVSSAPTATQAISNALKKYTSLRSAVREAIALGKERAFQAVERERVRTSWEIGKLILDHILLNNNRGEYGAAVTERLAKDIGVSASELRRMVEFARVHPNLASTRDLPWGHYRELLAVNDAGQRKQITTEAVREGWTQKELRAEIKKLKLANANAKAKAKSKAKAGGVASGSSAANVAREAGRPSLDVKPGKVGTYNITEIEGRAHYDLGFDIHLPVQGKGPQEKNPPKADLYTYPATVIKVYDGDTFHAWIDLGFKIQLKQRLRLRRLNAPELVTREGEPARKVLRKALMRDAGRILIRTAKDDDQYGRYLVDVWVDGKNIAGELLASVFFTVRAS